jgi:hypothetical protein
MRLETSTGPSTQQDDAVWARPAVIALLALKGVIIASLVFLILQIALNS